MDDDDDRQWIEEMLAEYAKLLTLHGAGSHQERHYAIRHGWHDELADQMETARRLKSACELSGNR